MYIAIDIGGTHTRVAAFSKLEIESEIDAIKFSTEKKFEDQYKEIEDFISSVKNSEEMQGIRISQTGSISSDKKMLLSSEFCPDFENKPFIQLLSEKFNTNNVFFENDATAAGFAELIFGKNKDVAKLAYVTISTGVGGVFIKKIQGKYEVLSTELGHMMIAGEKRTCNCGSIDCIEAYVGGHSLSQQFFTDAKDINDLRIWEKSVEYLALASVNLIRMCSPDALIFGGGMIENNEYVREKLSFEIKSQLRDKKLPLISISDFGDKIGVYGALALMGVNPTRII